VLERVDHRHVGPEAHDAIQQLDARPRRLGLGVEAALLARQVRRGQKLHAHRGDLGELHRQQLLRMLLQVGQRRHLEGMEGVAALVQQCHDVVVRADCIHEDKRLASHVIFELVTTRRLVRAALQVQQLLRAHRLEVRAELRVHA